MKDNKEITGSEDIIYSRYIDDRIDYLEDFLQQGYNEFVENQDNGNIGIFTFNEWIDDIKNNNGEYQSEIEELDKLNELKNDLSSPIWKHGLIHKLKRSKQ